MATISTPCIGVCLIDSELKICLGCGRTREEVGAWTRLSEAERLAIMAGLKARLEAAEAGETEAGHPADQGLGNWRAGL